MHSVGEKLENNIIKDVFIEFDGCFCDSYNNKYKLSPQYS